MLVNKLKVIYDREVRSKDADSIVSWRELMEMKLNPHPHLHSLFLNQLSKYDQVVKTCIPASLSSNLLYFL